MLWRLKRQDYAVDFSVCRSVLHAIDVVAGSHVRKLLAKFSSDIIIEEKRTICMGDTFVTSFKWFCGMALEIPYLIHCVHLQSS